jgi:hypothetical protein
MALKVNYKAALSEAYQDALRIERALLDRLIRVGEEFVTNARQKASVDSSAFPAKGTGIYQDQTANLRNSIGYVIYKDGAPIQENLVGAGEGTSAARQAIDRIPKKAGYVLIGVAGMNYASYLESLGYNVITSQGIVLFKDLSRSLKKLETKTGTEFSVLEQGRASPI